MPFTPDQLQRMAHAATLPVGYEKVRDPDTGLFTCNAGGMGFVILARDTKLNREVAVKLLQDDFAADSDEAERFMEEAHLSARLQHPNIPPVYDVGQFPDSRRPYMVMRFVKGESLFDQLKKCVDLRGERNRYLAIFEDIVRAVAYAHDRNVIHRDIKPGNVMIGAHGEVQVLDWGLAKKLVALPENEEVSLVRSARSPDSEDTEGGTALGTPQYLSPEQANGEIDKIDKRTDVFALGAVLCRILTGFPAYTGSPEACLAQAQIGNPVQAISRIESSAADSELIDLAKKCLATEIDKRPKDAKEVQQLLADWRIAKAKRDKDAEEERIRREEAEKARDHAQRLSSLALQAFNTMVFDVQQKLANRADTLAIRKKILDDAQRGLKQLIRDAGELSNGDRTLAAAHSAMGDLYLRIGETSNAQHEYQAAHDIAQRLVSLDASDTQAQRDLSVSYNNLGNVQLKLGRTHAALENYQDSLEIAKHLAEMDASDTQAQRDLSGSYDNLGNVQLKLSETRAALGNYQESLEIRKRLVSLDVSDTQAQRDLSVSYNKLGWLYESTREWAKAIEYYEQALAVAARSAYPNEFSEVVAWTNEHIAICRAKLAAE